MKYGNQCNYNLVGEWNELWRERYNYYNITYYLFNTYGDYTYLLINKIMSDFFMGEIEELVQDIEKQLVRNSSGYYGQLFKWVIIWWVKN